MTDTLTRRQQDQSFPVDIMTWRDLLVLLTDWGAGMSSALDNRLLRSGTVLAYRGFSAVRNWRYQRVHHTLTLNAAVDLVGYYDHTGGDYERRFVVTSGSIPSWAIHGHLRLGSTYYEVDANPTSARLTLGLQSNPGDDVGSALDTQTATLYRTTYPAPADFLQALDAEGDVSRASPVYVTPGEFAAFERAQKVGGEPSVWTVAGHPKYYGTQALKFYPYVTTNRPVSIYYRKFGRPLNVHGFASTDYGTATIDTGTDANRVTVPSGQALSRCIGSIFRIRSDSNTPEAPDGIYPYEFQASVISVDSNNNYLYLDRDSSSSYTSKAYVVSDPIDIPPYALNAFVQYCRLHFGRQAAKSSKELAVDRAFFDQDMIEAGEVDSGVAITSRNGWGYDSGEVDDLTERPWYSEPTGYI